MQDPTPLYHRIYLVLRDQIARGRYAGDAAMPTEMTLARDYAVSRETIRKALDQLSRQGLVRRERGRGTFANPPQSTGAAQADITGFVENLVAMGMRTEVKVESFAYEPAPPEVARDMGLAPRTTVQRAVRLRAFEGQRFSYATTWVREDVGRSYTARDMACTPLLRLFEAAGVRITGAHQIVSAIAADPRVAERLRVEIGAPLLSITRIVRDADGRGVERIHALYRPDIYAFTLDLTPGTGPSGTVWQPRPDPG